MIDWQPAATLPTDGRPFLATGFEPTGEPWFAICRYPTGFQYLSGYLTPFGTVEARWRAPTAWAELNHYEPRKAA